MHSHALTHHSQDQLDLVNIQNVLLLVEEYSVLGHGVANDSLEPVFVLQTGFLEARIEACLALDFGV